MSFEKRIVFVVLNWLDDPLQVEDHDDGERNDVPKDVPNSVRKLLGKDRNPIIIVSYRQC